MQPIQQPGQTQREPLKPLTLQQIDQLMALLDEWSADESGYEEETWDDLKNAIDQERTQISARRLFS
jgi:hypothetical protein